jgi:hypothetical protein
MLHTESRRVAATTDFLAPIDYQPPRDLYGCSLCGARGICRPEFPGSGPPDDFRLAHADGCPRTGGWEPIIADGHPWHSPGTAGR